MPTTRRTLLSAAVAAALAPEALAKPDTRVYELRTYVAHPGKIDTLHKRFREHTIRIFKRVGIDPIGFWTPTGKPDVLVYLLGFPNAEARVKSYTAFSKDREWPAIQSESERDGPLVASMDSIVLTPTDFSPPVRGRKGDPRLFELRTYTATPGNRERLVDRFRQHTVDLFKKHGMENVFYGVPQPDQKDAANLLVYLLAHKDAEARTKSFAAFGADPAWKEAFIQSELAAGGPLTIPGGVQSQLMAPTEYSPLK